MDFLTPVIDGGEEEARAAVGITDGTIRISVGLESVLDLVEDVEAALAGALGT